MTTWTDVRRGTISDTYHMRVPVHKRVQERWWNLSKSLSPTMTIMDAREFCVFECRETFVHFVRGKSMLSTPFTFVRFIGNVLLFLMHTL